MIDDLPPHNPKAFGLHVTDEEWAALQLFLSNETRIKRAFISGSRYTGRRQVKSRPSNPPDINIRLELRWVSDPAQHSQQSASLWSDWKDFWAAHRIDVDWHGLGDQSDHLPQMLIWPLHEIGKGSSDVSL
jgi:hypothetical protein